MRQIKDLPYNWEWESQNGDKTLVSDIAYVHAQNIIRKLKAFGYGHWKQGTTTDVWLSVFEAYDCCREQIGELKEYIENIENYQKELKDLKSDLAFVKSMFIEDLLEYRRSEVEREIELITKDYDVVYDSVELFIENEIEDEEDEEKDEEEEEDYDEDEEEKEEVTVKHLLLKIQELISETLKLL